MPYRLKDGVYSIKCRHPQCPFNTRFEINQIIMGVNEQDVECEAMKIARDMAFIKHNEIYGTKHKLKNPQIRKISGNYVFIGTNQQQMEDERGAVSYRKFEKNELILKKGDDAATICQVVSGYAFPRRNKAHRYKVGYCFGIAGLLDKQNRTADIIAGTDNTKIGFHNIIKLSKINPKKARQLYNMSMEDIFEVIKDLEKTIEKLEKERTAKIEVV